MSTHRIAVIAGDGIGTEVMPEGLRVLDAAARRFGIACRSTNSTSPTAPTWRATAR
jgi:isocitrate/isopropylmalate dehydrogenase